MVEINDWNDLDDMRNDLSANYTLGSDLDSSTTGYTGIGDSWKPLGFVSGDRNGNAFTGSLDGQGYKISDLVIEENSSSKGGVAFITRMYGGLIENLEIAGTVDSTIADYYFGSICANIQGSTIQNCASHVDVNAPNGVYIGGLVASSATASISGTTVSSTIKNSYNTGAVDGNDMVAGAIGGNVSDCELKYSYAAGDVSSSNTAGGLVAYNNGTVTDSYYDIYATNQSSIDGGPGDGVTTSSLQGVVPASWDNTNTWEAVSGGDNDSTSDGYPIIQSIDRENQLKAQGIYKSVPFEAYAQINGSVVQIQSGFEQFNGTVSEITEAHAAVDGFSNQL